MHKTNSQSRASLQNSDVHAKISIGRRKHHGPIQIRQLALLSAVMLGWILCALHGYAGHASVVVVLVSVIVEALHSALAWPDVRAYFRESRVEAVVVLLAVVAIGCVVVSISQQHAAAHPPQTGTGTAATTPEGEKKISQRPRDPLRSVNSTSQSTSKTIGDPVTRSVD